MFVSWKPSHFLLALANQGLIALEITCILISITPTVLDFNPTYYAVATGDPD